MIGIIIANSRYHPHIDAAQKQAPAPTRKLAPTVMLPSAVCQNPPAAKPKPIVAATKMMAKNRLVRIDRIRKQKDRVPSAMK